MSSKRKTRRSMALADSEDEAMSEGEKTTPESDDSFVVEAKKRKPKPKKAKNAVVAGQSSGEQAGASGAASGEYSECKKIGSRIFRHRTA